MYSRNVGDTTVLTLRRYGRSPSDLGHLQESEVRYVNILVLIQAIWIWKKFTYSSNRPGDRTVKVTRTKLRILPKTSVKKVHDIPYFSYELLLRQGTYIIKSRFFQLFFLRFLLIRGYAHLAIMSWYRLNLGRNNALKKPLKTDKLETFTYIKK